MWRSSPAFALTLVAGACQFDRPADVRAVDAQPIDAPPPCTPSTTVCDDDADVYTECDAAGAIVRQMTCPLGCATDTEQCLDIDPHNGLATYLDMVTDPPDLLATGPVVINTMTGLVAGNGVPASIPSFLTPVGARVFVVRDLRWPSTVEVVRNPGAPALAIVATGTILIEGSVDVSANADLAGPGGAAPVSTDTDCTMYDFFAPSNQGINGMGGAGGSTSGGVGGAGLSGAVGPAGPVHPLGTAPLGGCAGGTYVEATGGAKSIGGAGGGGLQLVSRKSITLTAAATLDASGGGGRATAANRPGAGGGAGGTIVLEAPVITLSGALVVVSVKGGGGSGAGDATLAGGAGGDGGTGAMPAPGGWTPATGTGGAGGSTGGPENGNTGLASSHHGGGGGGAAGTIATYSSGGTVTPTNGAALRGPRVDASLALRHVP